MPKTHIERPELPCLSICGLWSQEIETVQADKAVLDLDLCGRCVGFAHARGHLLGTAAPVVDLAERRRA